MGGIANTVGNVAKAVAAPALTAGGAIAGKVGGLPGMIAGGMAGNALGNAFNSQGPQQPQAPEQDPRLKAINERQLKLAEEYRKNIGSSKTEAGNLAAEGVRQDTSQGLKDIKTGANSRGLLYSGLNLGEQSNLLGSQQSRIASGQMAANKGIEEEANRLDANAANQAYTGANLAFSPQDMAYQSALNRQQGSLEASKSLGQGIGGLVGNALGSKKRG